MLVLTTLRRVGARSAPARVVAGSLLLLGAFAGCGDFANLVTPGSKGEGVPARIALSASVAASVGSAGEVVTLRVVSHYLKQDGSAVRIGMQSLLLSSSATQQVPVSVELAGCLADAERQQPGGSKVSCNIMLNLALLVNDVVVDEQVIGPLNLSPGATTPVTQPVSLFEIASIDVSVGSGPIVSPTDVITTVLGEAVTLRALIRDRSGSLVGERAVSWSSDSPSVATVGAASGTVTTIGVGTARVTASLGTITRTVAVQVVRAPAAVTITPSAGSGSGTVRSVPSGIDCRVSGATISGVCSFEFSGDAGVVLSSTPDPGSVFDYWEGACVGASVGAVCNVTMSQARTASVRFTALRRVEVVADAGDGRGRVTAPNTDLDCRVDGDATSGVCAVDVREGSTVVLTATPDAAVEGGRGPQAFGGWGNACGASTEAACTLTVGAALSTVSVRFHDQQLVRVAFGGSGNGRVTWGDGAVCTRSGGSISGTCAQGAAFGTVVTLTAAPVDARSEFVSWAGDCESVSGTVCRTTLTRSRQVTATFGVLRRLTVAAASSGDGRGRVTGPDGVDCLIQAGQATGTCASAVREGATVTLSARVETSGPANLRQTFGGWDGACASQPAADCTIVVGGGDVDVSPRFFDARKVRVTLGGKGGGNVTFDDGSVCTLAAGKQTGVCEITNVHGTTVSVVASADAQSDFVGWTGDCDRIAGTSCITTLTAGRSVVAQFAQKRLDLTLSLSGGGSGSVMVNGQNACTLAPGQSSALCTLKFDVGSPVTMTGVPGRGARFSGFGGDCSGVACSVALSRSLNVSAQFDLQQFALTVQASGTGAGDISLDGAPFCSLAPGQGTSTCTKLVNYGQTVQLSGAAAAGSSFSGLGGDCGNTNPCTLQVTQDRLVTATFNQPLSATLGIVMLGPGDGSVVTATGINCVRSNRATTGTCTQALPIGTVVTLVATPVDPSWFVKWGGACASEPGTTCTVTLTRDLTIGVGFDSSR